jgi:hypothetical protein
MPENEQMNDLIESIKVLITKLDKPKPDVKGWLTIITSFLATVVIAGLTLFYSNAERKRAFQERQQSFLYNQMRDSFQVEIQKANLKVDELRALKDLIPSLASKDSGTRSIAIQLLKASAEQENAGSSKTDTQIDKKIESNTDTPATTSVIEKFYSVLAVAQSSSESDEIRQKALKETESILRSNSLSTNDKAKGLTILSSIATSPNTPKPIKESAENVITNIKSISVNELPKLLESETITRQINSVILHHTGTSFTTSNFKGASTIFAIAKFQTSQLNWNRLSWHYAIAPDGAIWLGMPLNETAIHAQSQNKTSVSILLIVDGDKQLPTEAQKATVSTILKLLFSKLHLRPENFHPHHFYNNRKSCPGSLLDSNYIVQLAH